ncbi:glycosyltransferase [Agrobacterium rosae]|nr:glycosyltransferase [Agrobacterium rosae]MBN7803908.1 glycosyltransferase [Agrobacterium rosae]MCM2431700.1 glycosyltransferase family 4 protein [Agrobacterium rosae]MDX8302664.1 glycosyltransferase [Agrobacterium rosae]MDX8312302.1 glycosyltransferase [Agrobacterium rosae]MDX8328634.1 glycosyltransferase [Agrobacterium rosae]
MKILHVFETMPGGPATYFNEIVPSQIKALGAENIRVIVPDAHIGFLKNTPASSIATFVRRKRSTALPALARAVLHEVRSFRPDVVHAHSTLAGGIVRTIRAMPGKFPPVVYCPHGWVFDMETLGPLRHPARWAERILSPLADKIVAISGYEYEQGLKAGISAERMIVIENGISSQLPVATPTEWLDTRTKVLFVGRLDRQKGVDILLQAAAELKDKAVFRVIGAHVTTKNDLTQTLPANVELLGWRSAEDIAGHMAVCDVVAMPSRWEGFGLVALEAMRSRKPVIASAVGGLQSVVSDGKTGVLFPPGDHKALAAAIASRSSEGWAQMGAAGYERFMQRYRSERTNEELMQLYHHIVDNWSAESRRFA